MNVCKPIYISIGSIQFKMLDIKGTAVVSLSAWVTGSAVIVHAVKAHFPLETFMLVYIRGL